MERTTIEITGGTNEWTSRCPGLSGLTKLQCLGRRVHEKGKHGTDLLEKVQHSDLEVLRACHMPSESPTSSATGVFVTDTLVSPLQATQKHSLDVERTSESGLVTSVPYMRSQFANETVNRWSSYLLYVELSMLARLSLKKAMERFGEARHAVRKGHIRQVIGCFIGQRGVDKPVVRYVNGEVAQGAYEALRTGWSMSHQRGCCHRKGEIVLDGNILEGDWKADRGRCDGMQHSLKHLRPPPPERDAKPRDRDNNMEMRLGLKSSVLGL